jgi:hypothetical protein
MSASGTTPLIPESRFAIHHRIVMMALLPAKRDGGRYINPVPTEAGGLSLMFKVGRVSFSEQQRGRSGMHRARFTPILEFMQQAHNPACALPGSSTPPR